VGGGGGKGTSSVQGVFGRVPGVGRATYLIVVIVVVTSGFRHEWLPQS
jgi:hypothetical protein